MSFAIHMHPQNHHHHADNGYVCGLLSWGCHTKCHRQVASITGLQGQPHAEGLGVGLQHMNYWVWGGGGGMEIQFSP